MRLIKYKIIVTILFFFCCSNAFCQAKDPKISIEKFEQKLSVIDQKWHKKFDSLNVELHDSISVLKNELSTRSDETISNENASSKELENASNTIAYLSSIVSTFEIVFTVLAIFIAIVTLVLPFATYQYAVKPSKEAIKEMEKGFDEKLTAYLENLRNNQIESALDKIKSNSPEDKNQAISFLTYIQNEGLTDNQMFKIYQILKTEDHNASIKGQLAFILSTRKMDYSNELFNSTAVRDDPVIQQMAVPYFAKTDYKENYIGLKYLFEDKDSQYVNFNRLVISLNQHSSTAVGEIINDEKIIDLFTDEALDEIKGYFPDLIPSLGLDGIRFEDSYLKKKIDGISTV